MVSHDVMNNLYEAFVVPDLSPYAITSKNKNSYVSIDPDLRAFLAIYTSSH